MGEKGEYWDFSQEAREQQISKMIEEAREMGATDEQINAAFNVAAQKFMETNFMKEPRRN